MTLHDIQQSAKTTQAAKVKEKPKRGELGARKSQLVSQTPKTKKIWGQERAREREREREREHIFKPCHINESMLLLLL